MTTDKPTSDLKLERKECPKCGAVWLNGQHRWHTGAVGNDLDLAGLVCNTLDDPSQCINELRGSIGGDTWESRLQKMAEFEEELARRNKEAQEGQ